MSVQIFIKMRRMEKGFSQSELSRESGISKSFLSEVESNKKKPG